MDEWETGDVKTLLFLLNANTGEDVVLSGDSSASWILFSMGREGKCKPEEAIGSHSLHTAHTQLSEQSWDVPSSDVPNSFASI